MEDHFPCGLRKAWRQGHDTGLRCGRHSEAVGDALVGLAVQLNEKIGESEKLFLSWFTQAWFGELVFITNEHYNGKE